MNFSSFYSLESLSWKTPIDDELVLLLNKAGKMQSMGIAQRISWLVLWFVSLCVFFPTMLSLIEMRSEHYTEEYNRTHTYQGVVMSEEISPEGSNRCCLQGCL